MLDHIDEPHEGRAELSSRDAVVAGRCGPGGADAHARTTRRRVRRASRLVAGRRAGDDEHQRQSPLDWHGEFEHYCACKRLLIESMPADGVAVLVDESDAGVEGERGRASSSRPPLFSDGDHASREA